MKNTFGSNCDENREKPFMSAPARWMHGGPIEVPGEAIDTHLTIPCHAVPYHTIPYHTLLGEGIDIHNILLQYSRRGH